MLQGCVPALSIIIEERTLITLSITEMQEREYMDSPSIVVLRNK